MIKETAAAALINNVQLTIPPEINEIWLLMVGLIGLLLVVIVSWIGYEIIRKIRGLPSGSKNKVKAKDGH